MPEITITINTDGDTELKVNGVKGSGCKQLTAQIEKALGRTTRDTPTAEMHQTVSANNTIRG